jgi:sialate O-acetylesterase
MNRFTRAVLFGLLPACLAAPAPAAIRLPACLSSHMVLQQNTPVPIWGTAGTGEVITVEFAGRTQTATPDSQGRWQVKLEPLPASADPRTLTITAASARGATQKLELDDVLVGEVWLGSGQSNMAMPGSAYTNQDPVLLANVNATHPLLRLLGRGGWCVASTNDNRTFSALLFSFGVPLQKELGVPVGLLAGAAGGTPSGYWLSRETYESDPGCKADVERAMAAFDTGKTQAEYAVRLSAWTQAVAQAAQAGTPAPAQPRPTLTPGETRKPVGNLYEAHIRPSVPFAIRGVLWDQGESGTGIGGVNQDTLMAALIRGWRQERGQGDFPFLVVQKPSGGGCAWDPADPVTRQDEPFAPLPAAPRSNGDYRALHLRIMRNPGTFMVTSSDLGAGTHPACKSGYGLRAARVALGAVYGRPLEIYGPVLKSSTVEGVRMRLAFDHAGQGLATPTNAPLQGFSIAGTNRVFQWAKAAIEGPSIVVWSEAIPEPVAVRYAWDDRHPWANLFNRDGLPAQAFRTDDW